MKILALSKYGSLGASSRMRTFQYFQELSKEGFSFSVHPFFDNDQLAQRYAEGSFDLKQIINSYLLRLRTLLTVKDFDLIWIEKEALPWLPASFERWLLRRAPYVLDYDDALFHNYDLHRLRIVRWTLGRRLDYLMAGSSLVVAGNSYLANRAQMAGAARVEVVPTAIDLARYRVKDNGRSAKSRLVWIGSPSTARYLQLLHEPLVTLSAETPFTLRVIGAGAIEMPGVDIEILPWTEETEAALVGECDIGLMPLEDSPWEKGKCAYKLIQYMACALPTVASPVGANVDVVIDGETGYLAKDAGAWVSQLRRLLLDADLRIRMGICGRERVEQQYCIQRTAPRLIDLLSNVTRTAR